MCNNDVDLWSVCSISLTVYDTKPPSWYYLHKTVMFLMVRLNAYNLALWCRYLKFAVVFILSTNLMSVHFLGIYSWLQCCSWFVPHSSAIHGCKKKVTQIRSSGLRCIFKKNNFRVGVWNLKGTDMYLAVDLRIGAWVMGECENFNAAVLPPF